MATERVPVTRAATDVHPKVKAGGIAGAIAVAVVALFTQYVPDASPEVAAGVASAVTWLVQTGAAYAKRSWRTRVKAVPDTP